MKKIYSSIIAIGLILAAATAAQASDDDESASVVSTFQHSCSNIEFIYDSLDPTKPALRAVCRDTGGDLVQSTLVLKGINNSNGKLVQGPLSDDSTFQETCGNIHFVIKRKSVSLAALCEKVDGNFRSTTLPLSINNNNGNLSY